MAKVFSSPDDVTAKPWTATGGISSFLNFLLFSWRYLYSSYFAYLKLLLGNLEEFFLNPLVFN
jgi:hypothetical protein